MGIEHTKKGNIGIQRTEKGNDEELEGSFVEKSAGQRESGAEKCVSVESGREKSGPSGRWPPACDCFHDRSQQALAARLRLFPRSVPAGSGRPPAIVSTSGPS